MNEFKAHLVIAVVGIAFALLGGNKFRGAPPAWAADHGDAPLMAQDAGADMADTYFFLDPNDNLRVIIAMTTRGFIVPGESENLTVFDPDINYRFAIENTGDASSDMNIEVRFSPKTGFLSPQIATISIRTGSTPTGSFTALTTVSSATSEVAPDPVITMDGPTGITFFAGMTDDPFFFDVTAELLYRASRFAGSPDPSVFSRARDTFAGYNVLAIVLSVPIDLLRGSSTDVLGYSGYTERAQRTKRSRFQGLRDKGKFIVIDRMGIPAINTVLVPYPKKDAYNRGTTSLDPQGMFAGDIVTTLRALLTDDTNIGILADLAVNNGDYLRLDLSIPNAGPGGGTNPEAGFPNGRRPGDDVVDTIVTIINNQQQVTLGQDAVDNVNANDKPFRDTFPFLAAPHQPRPAGTLDDQTRN